MAIQVTIEDKFYYVAQSIDDLMLIDWVELMTILSRREYKEIGKMATSDEILKELVETANESLDFKEDKLYDILCILSSIPKALFVEYPSLSDEIGNLVDWSRLYKDDSVVTNEIEVYEVKYTRLQLESATFQHWCDFENFVSDYLLIAFVVFLDNGKPYNRYHKDFETKLLMFGRLPAKGNAALLQSILDEISSVRTEYNYIYDSNDEEGTNESAGRYTEQHHKYFKWEDVIMTIAETNLFNSDKGTLNAVRNAPLFDVLEYLNLKRSKDSAEYKDFKAKEKGNKVNL